jgi:hypothetical protein
MKNLDQQEQISLFEKLPLNCYYESLLTKL